MTDPKEIVRTGYDAVSHRYRADDAAPPRYAAWLDLLRRSLPERADVLDLGCGCGVPVARDLTAAGHVVTGVDLSAVQIERARRLVPAATFRHADASALRFDDGSFDAVVCLYMLIHLPRAEQEPVIAAVRRWLRPGGTLLATVGALAWTGEDADWLGGGARMWWSHPSADTSREWLRSNGFEIVRDEFVPEGDSGHQLLVATAMPDTR